MITRQDIIDMGYPDEPWFGNAIAAVNAQGWDKQSPTYVANLKAMLEFFKDGGGLLAVMYTDIETAQADAELEDEYRDIHGGQLYEDDGA